MRDKKNSYPGIQIGVSFLLVIFIILCLVIFATLSLSGALRDNEYSQKSAKRTTDYYKACSQAQETIGNIDSILSDAAKSAGSYEDYCSYVTEHAAQIPGLTCSTDSGVTNISFTENITDQQILEVTLALSDDIPSGDEAAYRIVTWKENASKNWEEKTTLPVLGSDGEK